MKILNFIQTFQQRPVFSVTDVQKIYPDFDRKNLVRWQDKGLVQRIRNNWYALPGKIKDEAGLFSTANRIYSPSYISLESAFSYYGWIPEGVFTITSITTQKTAFFSSELGAFKYTNLKKSLFFGFEFPGNFSIAEPEKALLDFIYLHSELNDPIAFEELRWYQDVILSKITMAKLDSYAQLFASGALDRRLKSFKKFLYGKC